MKVVKGITKLLVIVGALNWGLVGFFQYDAVADLLGGVSSMGARIVYALVGLAGLYKFGCFFCCRNKNCGCGCSNCGSGCNCCNKKHQQ